MRGTSPSHIDVVFSDRAEGFVGPALHAFEIDCNPKWNSIEELGEPFGTGTVPWIIVFSEGLRKAALDRIPRGIEELVLSRGSAKRPAP